MGIRFHSPLDLRCMESEQPLSIKTQSYSICYVSSNITSHFLTGDRFDLREFHDRILRLGPVPLSLMEFEINRWIDLYAPKPSQATVHKNPFFTLCLCIGFLFFVTQNTTEGEIS